jgi:hypothetical protein
MVRDDDQVSVSDIRIEPYLDPLVSIVLPSQQYIVLPTERADCHRVAVGDSY